MALPEIHAIALEAHFASQTASEVLGRLTAALGTSSQLMGAWIQERDALYARQRQLEQQLEVSQQQTSYEKEQPTFQQARLRQLEGQVLELRAELEATRLEQQAVQASLDAERERLEQHWRHMEEQRQLLDQQRQQLQQQQELLQHGCAVSTPGRGSRVQQGQRKTPHDGEHGSGDHSRRPKVGRQGPTGNGPVTPCSDSDVSLPPSQPRNGFFAERVPETLFVGLEEDLCGGVVRPDDAAAAATAAEPKAHGDTAMLPSLSWGAGPSVADTVVAAAAEDRAARGSGTQHGDPTTTAMTLRAAATTATTITGTAAAAGSPTGQVMAFAAAAAAIAAAAAAAKAEAAAVWESRERELTQDHARQLEAAWAESRASQADLQLALSYRRTSQQLRADNKALQQQLSDMQQLLREMQAAAAAAAAAATTIEAVPQSSRCTAAAAAATSIPAAAMKEGSAVDAAAPCAVTAVQGGQEPAAEGAAVVAAATAGDGSGDDDDEECHELSAWEEVRLLVSERDKYRDRYREAKQSCREARQLARHWQSAYWGLVAAKEGPEAVTGAQRLRTAGTRDGLQLADGAAPAPPQPPQPLPLPGMEDCRMADGELQDELASGGCGASDVDCGDDMDLTQEPSDREQCVEGDGDVPANGNTDREGNGGDGNNEWDERVGGSGGTDCVDDDEHALQEPAQEDAPRPKPQRRRRRLAGPLLLPPPQAAPPQLTTESHLLHSHWEDGKPDVHGDRTAVLPIIEQDLDGQHGVENGMQRRARVRAPGGGCGGGSGGDIAACRVGRGGGRGGTSRGDTGPAAAAAAASAGAAPATAACCGRRFPAPPGCRPTGHVADVADGAGGRGGGSSSGWLNKRQRSRSWEPTDADGCGGVGAGLGVGGGSDGGRDGGSGASSAGGHGGGQGGAAGFLRGGEMRVPLARRYVQQQLPFLQKPRQAAAVQEQQIGEQPRRSRLQPRRSWHYQAPNSALHEPGRSAAAGGTTAAAAVAALDDDDCSEGGGGGGIGSDARDHSALPPQKRKKAREAVALDSGGGGGAGATSVSRNARGGGCGVTGTIIAAAGTAVMPPPPILPPPAPRHSDVSKRPSTVSPHPGDADAAGPGRTAAAAAIAAGTTINAAGATPVGREDGGPSAKGGTAAVVIGGGVSGRNGPGYKYSTVVRGRADRDALQAVECAGCRAFYEAVATWGGTVAPCCTHMREQPAAAVSAAATSNKHNADAKTAAAATAAAAAGGAARIPMPGPVVHEAAQPQAAMAAALRHAGGRHRFKYVPPATPEGFWDIGFGDTQD